MASGEAFPSTSFWPGYVIFTTCTTTFFAETCWPLSTVCGTVPWKRSHTPRCWLHRQYTSESPEKSRWTTPTFFDVPERSPYSKTADGGPSWAFAAAFHRARVLVYRLCGSGRLGSRTYAFTATS